MRWCISWCFSRRQARKRPLAIRDSRETARSTFSLRSSAFSLDRVTSLQAKVAALRSPLAYDEPTRTVTAIETHHAWVFLTDDRVYKLKKPMRMPDLDLSNVAARKFNCDEELRLNRRLARDVYLDVVPLTMTTEGALRIGGKGVVVDWLVKMRRLPSEAMLDRAIAAGAFSVERLEVVGRMLARFYREQPTIEVRDYVSRIRSQMETDRSELLAADLRLNAKLVESVASAQIAVCDMVQSELAMRARERRIVEGHGDLRPEHICLTDPPCVIDCLEFSLDLRTLDPGEELAFLSLECERLGDPEPAQIVLNAYRAESDDPITPQLLDFYRSRRATVRAKLMAWSSRDPDYGTRNNWRAKAEDYLQRAHRYARRAAGVN
jgi:aminoglycoside phosphotransferase family enzyme